MAEKESKNQAGNGPGKRRLLRRAIGKLLLILAGVFFGLLLCEVILRVSGYSNANFYIPDPVVGVALRPNAEGWWTKEGHQYIRINSQGLRDREHTKAKPANTVRVAVLGDSYSEAMQVPMEKAFWAIMEARLRECGAMKGGDVEVLNFGVSGYGTAQELLTLREKVWDYAPDIVLLAVTTTNDIRDDSRALKNSNDTPYFVFSDGHLVRDDSFRSTWIYRFRRSSLNYPLLWLKDHSRVVQAFYQVREAISVWFLSREGTSAGELGINEDIYREPRDEVWRNAWRVTEALIVLMRDEVKERHAKFFVVTLSGGLQVHPDPNVWREAMVKRGLNVFYPDLRIKDFCERENIPVLMLAPALQLYAEQNKAFLHGFDKNLGAGHWNELGHRIGGEMIAGWLCRELSGAS